MVRHENVMRGSDPYINYKCGSCRYSWQVKDTPKRQAGTGKRSPGSSEQTRKDER